MKNLNIGKSDAPVEDRWKMGIMHLIITMAETVTRMNC